MSAAAVEIEPLDRPIDATLVVPGSKSLTNRALLLAGMARGRSALRGLLVADDTEAMLGALGALGIAMEVDRAGRSAVVDGCGGTPPASVATVDARRSGTTARFLLPVLAALPGRYHLTGSPQLRGRPMGDLLAAVGALGGGVVASGDEPSRLPVEVGGGLAGGVVAVPGDVTSQYLSGLMLAGPLTGLGIRIEVTTELVSRPYVELTARLMADFGATVQVDDREISVEPGGYVAASVDIEPDASSASYLLAAAALCGGTVRVAGLSRRSTQGDVVFVDVLAAMGAEVIEGDDWLGVRGTGRLRGVEVDLRDLPDMALTVATLAPFADSPTTVRGVEVIRGHESDRIAVLERELRKLGVSVDVGDGWFTVHPAAAITPAVVDTYDDHRVAMSFALVGLRAAGVRIADPDCVDKTFPEFWDVLASLRAR